ncbi:hypothetical protein TNCV_3111301 [Trichonephila clavipes]|nr:hypothetical protein TNCV_3111301 [Trichonephila clavipes]
MNQRCFEPSKTILDRVLGARAAGVHYRLISVWTLVPVRLGKQLSDHSTVDDFASEAADCRHTYTMANCPQRWKEGEREKRKEGEREKEKKSSKRRGLVVLGSGEENPRVLFRDADQESKTRMRNNALRTGPRQAVDKIPKRRPKRRWKDNVDEDFAILKVKWRSIARRRAEWEN